MNPEIKTKWLEALRSGDYRQGRNVLKQQHGPKDTPQFCCLGVLCDLAIEDGLTVEVDEVFFNEKSNTYYNDCYELLPEAVADWAGLPSVNPEVNIYDHEVDAADLTTIADLNDEGSTFAEIADVIEKEL